MKFAGVIAAIGGAIALGGCFASSDAVQMQAAPAQTARLPAAYPIDKLVGRWGVASYREEKDRARTEAHGALALPQSLRHREGPDATA